MTAAPDDFSQVWGPYPVYDDIARLQYGRMFWRDPVMRERLLCHWQDERHPYRERFERYRPLVEEVFQSSLSDKELDQSLRERYEPSLRNPRNSAGLRPFLGRVRAAACVPAHSLRKRNRFVILGRMKAALLVTLALATTLPSFPQYSARTLTSKVVPQPQQPAQPARPAQYAPAPPPVPPRPATPAELAKVKADKSKNEVKQFDFYKRRAEEGSDHAQYELGMRFLNGKGTDHNPKQAREWLAKASKQGHTQATKKLAELGPEPASVEVKPVIVTKPESK